MYCKKCGAENSDQNRFCEKCGKPLYAAESNVNVEQVKGFLFDETNPIWYKIVKALIIICTVLIFAGGFVSFLGIAIEANFLMGLVILLCSWLGGALSYVFAMVGLNFIKNVNTIREILEKNN